MDPPPAGTIPRFVQKERQKFRIAVVTFSHPKRPKRTKVNVATNCKNRYLRQIALAGESRHMTSRSRSHLLDIYTFVSNTYPRVFLRVKSSIPAAYSLASHRSPVAFASQRRYNVFPNFSLPGPLTLRSLVSGF